MEIEIKEGKKGRWRWFVRNTHGKFKAMCNPYGFDSKQDAYEDAIDVFQSPVTAYDVDGYELFAGYRDFSS